MKRRDDVPVEDPSPRDGVKRPHGRLDDTVQKAVVQGGCSSVGGQIRDGDLSDRNDQHRD